jgi:hypothetical protein
MVRQITSLWKRRGKNFQLRAMRSDWKCKKTAETAHVADASVALAALDWPVVTELLQ